MAKIYIVDLNKTEKEQLITLTNKGQPSARKIKQMFGISRKTLKRWMAYFRDEFPASIHWQRLRGRLVSGVSNNELPAGLISYFLKNFQSPQQALIGCLMFLASEPVDRQAS